jgi:5-methylcytosine-specific restriction protein A
MFASEFLTEGRVYTRKELGELFSIRDATLKNGIYWLRDFNSIWLFVTEEKQTDRTPYRDLLNGDTLSWEGQTSGRTDGWVIEHQGKGLEILLFYRKAKYEFAEAGFRYCGRFRYDSHQDSRPTRFILKSVNSAKPAPVSRRGGVASFCASASSPATRQEAHENKAGIRHGETQLDER